MAEKMKKDYDLMRKSWGYLINSINDQVVCFSVYILARKIMRNYWADKVPAHQCIIGCAVQQVHPI